MNWGVENSIPKGTTLKAEFTRITPVYPCRVYVQWVLHNPTPATTYTFDLYRSGSAEGPWESLETDYTDFFCIDSDYTANPTAKTPGLFTLNSIVYYRIVVKVGTTVVAETIETDGAYQLNQRIRGIRRKLMRDAEIYLRKVTGTHMAVLKRKRWGEPCTVCQSATGQSILAKCSSCYGTGIVGGYWTPVYGFGQRTAAAVEVQPDVSGELETHRIQLTMLEIPKVEPDDIVVFRDGRRYIIEQVSPTQLRVTNVHQECVISELSRSSAVYSITVDPWHSPSWY